MKIKNLLSTVESTIKTINTRENKSEIIFEETFKNIDEVIDYYHEIKNYDFSDMSDLEVIKAGIKLKQLSSFMHDLSDWEALEKNTRQGIVELQEKILPYFINSYQRYYENYYNKLFQKFKKDELNNDKATYRRRVMTALLNEKKKIQNAVTVIPTGAGAELIKWIDSYINKMHIALG